MSLTNADEIAAAIFSDVIVPAGSRSKGSPVGNPESYFQTPHCAVMHGRDFETRGIESKTDFIEGLRNRWRGCSELEAMLPQLSKICDIFQEKP